MRGFAAEVPSAGLKLSKGELTLSTTYAQQFLIHGQVTSGAGTLAINGNAGLGTNEQTHLTLKGSQFTAADIPAARVVISPDLTVKQDASGINIGGALSIDSAAINSAVCRPSANSRSFARVSAVSWPSAPTTVFARA